MAGSTALTVGRSLPRWLALLVLLPVCAAVAVWAAVGVGMILYVAFAAAVVLSAIGFVAMSVSQRPRLCITPEGFTYHKLFGNLAHTWQDIDGPFAVIKIGWSKAVGYNLTADYQAAVGKKPTTDLSGYDEAIVGVFEISKEELAALLNEHQKQSRGEEAAEGIAVGPICQRSRQLR